MGAAISRTDATSLGPRGRGRKVLWMLLALATALRLWNLGFGLDLEDPRHAVRNNVIDERGMVEAELDGILSGRFHPGDFLYRGSGGFYVLGLADLLWFLPRGLTHADGWAGALAELRVNPSPLHLVHRFVSALFGVLTVLWTYRLVRRELGERAALLACFFLAVAYVHVRESHFGTIDVLWSFLTLATVDALLRLQRAPGRAAYLRGALWIGATAATKYFGGLLVLHLGLAHLFARSAARNAGRPVPGWRELLQGSLGVPLGFLLLSSYVVYALPDLIEVVRWSIETYGSTSAGGGPLPRLGHHVRYTFAVGLGEPVFALALIGMGLGLARPGAPRFLALSALLLLPTTFLTAHTPVRFGLAPAILLVPLAALAAERLTAGRPVAVVGLVALLAGAPSLARSLSFDALIGRPDSRVEMVRHLDAQGAGKGEVLAVGFYGLPRLSGDSPEPFEDLVLRVRSDPGITPAAARALAEEAIGRAPRFVLRDETSGMPPDHDALVWEPIRAVLARDYDVALHLEGRGDPGSVRLPDPIAGYLSLFVPYDRPWAMTRPGPTLVLYERR
ncbi:MAG TPA: glycosyltransferase family 39 protein [Planctomycetota bacterium]